MESFATIARQEPLVPSELSKFKQERQRELKIKEIVKQVIFHSVFLWVMYVIAYSNKDLNTFWYQKKLSQLFIHTKTEIRFEEVFEIFNVKINIFRKILEFFC